MTGQDELGRLLRLLGDAKAETAWRLDALLDLERAEDPRITPVLLSVLSAPSEPRSLRLAVLRSLRDASGENRAAVVRVFRQLLDDPTGNEVELRVQAALALGDCTDLDGVVAVLGEVCSDSTRHFDVRYAAFTSLERAGPTPDCIALLRQLSEDETLGPAAHGILVSWRSA